MFGIIYFIIFVVVQDTQALSQQTLSPELHEVLKKLDEINKRGGHNAGILSDADRALLFANNDAINAAAINNEIPDRIYQAAQADFANLNREFALGAAKDAKAKFTVQQRTADGFSPGTDSDFITKVKSKEQIALMKEKYNRRVNKFLHKNGALETPRGDWQKKLDTDFMADPEFITSPEEFREIAAMNNDAYKNRFAAEYEKISRQNGGGKIGPQHVTGYAQEMGDFVSKKRSKIQSMLKNPSLFNDPANRAKVIQMMAQEQKYISRIESLDDFLRKQEGLPSRNRGMTVAKQGSNRSPHNVNNIKSAHAAANASQGKAIEDLAETMGEIAKNNKNFSATAADDLAKIIANAPPEHQAKAIAALKRSNPKLAKIVRARNPALGSIDDLARAGDKASDIAKSGDDLVDALKTSDRINDASKASKIRKSLSAASRAMEKLGKVAAAADLFNAAGQMKKFLDTLRVAWDPNTSDEEAARLFKEADRLARELSRSSALIAIMERHPVVAGFYGTWTLACSAGAWVTPDVDMGEIAGRVAKEEETCLDRQLTAIDHAWNTLSGKRAADIAGRQFRCDQFVRAVKEKRLRPQKSFSVLDICNFIKSDVSIMDVVERVDKPLKQNITSKNPTATKECDPEKVVNSGPDKDGFIPQPTHGGDGFNADCPTIGKSDKSVDGPGDGEKNIKTANSCTTAERHYEAARTSYKLGDADAYKENLIKAKNAMEKLANESCNELASKITRGQEQAEILKKINTTAGELLSACKGNDPEARATQLRELSGLLSRTKQPHVQQLRRRLLAAHRVATAYAKTKELFKFADIDGANNYLNISRSALEDVDQNDCPDLRAAIAKAPRVIGAWSKAVDKVSEHSQNCDIDELKKYRSKLQGMNSPIAMTLVAQLSLAIPDCIEQEESKRNASCKEGFKPGPTGVDGSFYCLPTKATADLWCENNNPGSGYRAGPIRKDGSYDCHYTKAGLNALCQKKYGSGSYARVKNDRYWCMFNKSARNRICRDQYGRGWYAGTPKKDGTFLCHTNKKNTPTVNRRQQPNVSAQDIANGLATLGTIMNQVQRANRSNKRNCRTVVGSMFRDQVVCD